MNPVIPKPDDEPRTRSDEADPPRGPRPPLPSLLDSCTSDEINKMLASSLDSPEPDPMLGGAGSWDAEKAAAHASKASKRSRSGDSLDFGVNVAAPRDGVARDEPDRAGGARQPYDWGRLILKSYASAVTLALAWVLWTGRGVQGPAPASASRETSASRRRAVEPEQAPSAAAAEAVDRSTPLGKTLVVGDLEVTPLSVLRRNVRAVRERAGKSEARDSRCLVLTLRVKNRGTAPLKPIDAEDLRGGDAFIEAPPGPAITMFSTGPRVGWEVKDHTFPTLEPGTVEDLVVISEPVSIVRLTSGMVWRLWMAPGEDRERKVGVAVKFDRNDVHDGR